MTISPITFENTFREELLDVIYGQWHSLGAPFSVKTADVHEVIDPEALLWCSLEFLPTEPRLFETVAEWLRKNDNYIIRQRLKKHAASSDPRARIWHALEHTHGPEPQELPELPHGVESPEEITAYFNRLARRALLSQSSESRIGLRTQGPSTLLLRARDLLGGDVRHFLLVYLLANEKGGKIRTIQEWSGYSYRGIFEAATRWEAAGVAHIDHGYGSLSDVKPWRALLHYPAGRITIVNWFALFDELIRFLRALAKARRKDFKWDNPVLAAFRRDAYKALSSPFIDGTSGDAPSIARLRELIPLEDRSTVST